MKLSNKYISLLLVLAMILSMAACQKKTEVKEEATPTTIKIGGLTGPTTMGIVKLLSDAEEGKTSNIYESTIAGSADELTPLLIKGELDVLVGPANLAAVLNSKTDGQIQMLAIDVLGVLNILSKGIEINSWADLKGQTIYATGKGSTPEYSLNYLLTQNGLVPGEDVTIEFKSEPAEILALAKSSEKIIAMLPQPYATVAQIQVEGFSVAMNLSDEWDKLNTGSRMVTACVMIRKEFAEQNPGAISILLDELKNSVDWVNANTEEASTLVEKYIGVKAAIAKKAIPNCNLVLISGDEMIDAASGYFKVLYEQNPASLGGKLPDESEGFYYK